MPENRITDPGEIERYVKEAKLLYGPIVGPNFGGEFPDPPVVERTPDGARVMIWLPVVDEDAPYSG